MTRQAGRKKLPRAAQLRASSEIRRILRRGRRHSAGPYVVHGLPAEGSGGSRLAVVVPRRAGNQVARNRIKRLVREAFRLERPCWERDWDLVVYVRSSPGQPTLEEAIGLLKDAIEVLDKKSPSKTEDRG